MTSYSDLTYPPTHPKLWHKSYLIWFLEPHIEHKIWWRWMHIHILSLLKVIVILYSIRQTQINQNLHIGKWKYAKKTKGNEYMKLWHLCLTPTHLLYMSQFLLQKKLCFETGTHPPFGPMSQNTQFFFEGFPKAIE